MPKATTTGTNMRALANDRELASMLGVPVRRVEAIAWGVSGAIAGVTAIFLADQVLYRHAHIGEEDLVDFVLAVQRDDGTHFHARCIHVDQQEADAFLLLRQLCGARQNIDVARICGLGRPDLLTIDDPVPVLQLGLGLRVGEIAAIARLRIALAPNDIAASSRRGLPRSSSSTRLILKQSSHGNVSNLL